MMTLIKWAEKPHCTERLRQHIAEVVREGQPKVFVIIGPDERDPALDKFWGSQKAVIGNYLAKNGVTHTCYETYEWVSAEFKLEDAEKYMEAISVLIPEAILFDHTGRLGR